VRRPASEKLEIIRLVEGTELSVRATLRQLGIPKSTFYGWYERYLTAGFEGLHDSKPARTASWNRISEAIKDEVLDLALE
jgi:putative transposase